VRDILICGDILRANLELTHRPYNTRWFSALVRQAIAPLGLTSEVLGYDPPAFDFEDFYRAIYQEAGAAVLHKWARFYDATSFNQDMTRRLFDIFSGKLVILFEGSRSVLRYIASIGGTYVNVRVSPLRFASDLVFIVESNNEAVQRAIGHFEMEQSFIQVQSIALKRQMSGVSTIFAKPTLIFLGQVPGDASLIQDGEFTSIAIPDGLDVSRFGADDIYHKPHPIDANAPDMARWKGFFPSSKLLEMPTYGAICSEGDVTLVTVSSGAGYEAQVLGHECHFVSPHNWAQGGPRWARFTSVLHEYWSPDFWQVVFDALDGKAVDAAAIAASRQAMVFTPDRLRQTIDAKWAARNFAVAAS
jgi:hypothetical protein